ncbi:hypothetical protein QE152_g10442 [Popillia japonica]
MKTEMGDMKNAIKEVSTDQKEFRKDFQLLKLENETLKKTNTKQKIFGMKNRTRIGTWNVRTMLEPATLTQTIKEMEVLHIKVLGLSEIRWSGQGERLNSNGSLRLYSGSNQDEDRTNGVGFLLDKEVMASLLNWNPISDRIITA